MGNSNSSSSSPHKNSIHRTEVINGSYKFKVTNYSRIKAIRTGQYVKSDRFTIGGHEWTIFFFPNGIHTINGRYIAIFLTLPNENSNVRVMFDFCLLDQTGKPATLTQTRLSKPRIFKDSMIGFPNFMKRAKFDRSEYIKDDSFTIKCNIAIIRGRDLVKEDKLIVIEVPPSDLQKRLENLLCSGDGSDVSFEVEGEIIEAHKCIMIAKSKVFRAQFLSEMNENNGIIKIKDMKASVFKKLLHFIYTDKIPDYDENIGDEELAIMHEQLRLVVDRYGLKVKEIKVAH